MYTSIHPGKPWLDTDGNRIQAHGGSILFVDGTYYWYGENKDKTYAESGYWYNGVNCYSSHDLMNWQCEGNILKASEDSAHPLHYSKMCDRPHILFNYKTKKYVMWIKVMGDEPLDASDSSATNRQFMCIATADSITGEFVFVKKVYPLGMYSGDFDLYADPADGKAYIIFERVHTELVIADLTDDYLDVTGYYSSHFPHPGPVTTREAPCLFKKGASLFLITSGTSGYFPNPSELATAKLIHGPWTVLGAPCIDDQFCDSFNAQFASVFKVPGKDLYIALGDRWMDGTAYEDAVTNRMNTALANYVWLPVQFDFGTPQIVWKDEWSPADYTDESEKDEQAVIRDGFRAVISNVIKRRKSEETGRTMME